MKVQFGLNDKVTIYPNAKGIQKMIELVQTAYKLSTQEATAEILDKIESVEHIGDGYTSQLWDIMGLFGEMFFLGTSYFENTFVDINSTV